jgi:hypothetical protein
VGLERGPLCLVSAIEELLERKSSGSVLENRDYGRMVPPYWPHDTLYPQKVGLTSPTSGGRSVGIVRSLTKATELYITFQTNLKLVILLSSYHSTVDNFVTLPAEGSCLVHEECYRYSAVCLVGRTEWIGIYYKWDKQLSRRADNFLRCYYRLFPQRNVVTSRWYHLGKVCLIQSAQ